MKSLMEWDRRGHAVFSSTDLRAIFPERSEKTFSEGVRRLVRQGVLQRAARGVYVNPLAVSRGHLLEQIAVTLRRGEFSYLSLETALGEYGIISQQTVNTITVMTTGRKGRFHTPWGAVSFCHTARAVSEILDGTVDAGRPLRLARPQFAHEDLRRVGRNLELVETEEFTALENLSALPS